MTKKDFFRIIVKLFGLYLFLQIITNIYTFIPFISFFDNATFSLSSIKDFVNLLLILIPLGVLLLLNYNLIFKTDSIIKLFQLTKGYDDDTIHFSALNTALLASFASIFIGMYLFFSNIRYLIIDIFKIFTARISQNDYETGINNLINGMNNNVNFGSIFYTFIQVGIGYLLISNHKKISNWIIEKNKD